MLQVDVFSDVPLRGNPLAVFPDGDGLSDAEMQAIAREMNLSETTFVLPPESPDADYRVRIFTPASELPFAGHPTLGTAHVLLELGRVRPTEGRLHQQTLAGIQAIEVEDAGEEGPLLTMTVPPPKVGPGPPRARIAAALRVPEAALVEEPWTVDVGVVWHVARLDTLERMQGLDPDMAALTELGRETGASLTVFCEAAADPDCALRLRTFAPSAGIPEDPVCGSGNAAVGAVRAEQSPDRASLAYQAEQGIEMGRGGRAHVSADRSADGALRIRVGGRACTLLDGTLSL